MEEKQPQDRRRRPAVNSQLSNCSVRGLHACYRLFFDQICFSSTWQCDAGSYLVWPRISPTWPRNALNSGGGIMRGETRGTGQRIWRVLSSAGCFFSYVKCQSYSTTRVPGYLQVTGKKRGKSKFNVHKFTCWKWERARKKNAKGLLLHLEWKYCLLSL